MDTFHMCPTHDFHQLLEKVSSQDGDYLLTMTTLLYLNLTIVSSLIVSLPAMIYGIFCCLKERTMTLHFVGLARPKKLSKSHSTAPLSLCDNIDTADTLLTIETALKPTDSVGDLKRVIKDTYAIPSERDVLILFAHHMLTDETRPLSYYHIAEHSLFTLAVCDKEKVLIPAEHIEPDLSAMTMPTFGTEMGVEPVQDVNALFGMYESDSDSDDEETSVECSKNAKNEEKNEIPSWPRLGFDVVMQMESVVHRMPICGHEMNRESLLMLALSTMKEPTNLSVRCPHRNMKMNSSTDKLCNAEWPYAAVLEVLRSKDDHSVLVPQTGAEAKVKQGHRRTGAIAPIIVAHREDDIKEDIDAVALNAVFADSDIESDDESDQEMDEYVAVEERYATIASFSDDEEADMAEALQAISMMFDNDEPEMEEMGLLTTLNGLRSSCVAVFDALRNKVDIPKIADALTVKTLTAATPCEVYEPFVVEWTDFAKLELLSARNVIQQKCDVQKCPRCKSLFYRNADASRMAFEAISTIEHIEREFKFECCFCPKDTLQTMVRNPLYGKNDDDEEAKAPSHGIHREDDIEEDIDAEAVNAMSGVPSDDEEEEDEVDEEADALHEISVMFDDDEHEFNEVMKPLNALCWCCGAEWTDGHFCDEAFKRDLCDILKMSEPKRIGTVDGVPSMRSCPECCQLIFHTDACKHMQCGSCKTRFCHVCLGVRDKVKGWACGSYSSACPVTQVQTMETLPDTIVVTKRAFKLYE